MSKGPSWVGKALNNQTGNKVGDKSLAQETVSTETRKKPGRKKASVKRKQVMMSLSDSALNKIETLEAMLKLEGVSITRGRSETSELSVHAILCMLKNDKFKNVVIDFIQAKAGEEDRDAEEILSS